MLDDLINLAEGASADGSTSVVIENQNFSLFEMIFWYSALVFMILIFIVYRKTVKSDKKRLTNAIDKITKNINTLDHLIGIVKEDSKFKEYTKGVMCLNSIENTLITIYDKTKLQDIDKAFMQIKKVEKACKKTNDDKTNYKKYLMNIKKEYDKLQDQMLVIIRLVK